MKTMSKLKKVKFFHVLGNKYAIEVSKDYSIKIKLIVNGMVDYILNGSDLPIKDSPEGESQ